MSSDLPAPGHHPSLDELFARRRSSTRNLFESPQFVRFDERLDEALNRIVARWRHAAAPGACRKATFRR